MSLVLRTSRKGDDEVLWDAIDIIEKRTISCQLGRSPLEAKPGHQRDVTDDPVVE